MEYKGTMTRMQAGDLPRVPTLCNLKNQCVYRIDGVCDLPWINKGNGDAACHKMANRAIYAELELVTPNGSNEGPALATVRLTIGFGAPGQSRGNSMHELKVGDRIKDNDPRMGANRLLTITEVMPNGVAAEDSMGKRRMYLRKHIHTDGKPRRSGFDLVTPNA